CNYLHTLHVALPILADFTSSFWSWFIIIVTLLSIVALLIFTIRMGGKRKPGEKAQSVGHIWDEDLHELNNPLPRWWYNLFLITLDRKSTRLNSSHVK